MQATEILFSLGGRLVNIMCLFICIVIMIIINIIILCVCVFPVMLFLYII